MSMKSRRGAGWGHPAYNSEVHHAYNLEQVGGRSR